MAINHKRGQGTLWTLTSVGEEVVLLLLLVVVVVVVVAASAVLSFEK
jgi:hypothetical protein